MKNYFNLNDLDKCMKRASDIYAEFVRTNKDAMTDGKSDFYIEDKDLDFLIYAFEKYYFSKSGTLLGGEYPKTPKMKVKRINELSRAITGKGV